jgi:ankyrin repeat protein
MLGSCVNNSLLFQTCAGMQKIVNGFTALHSAASKGHDHILQLLLSTPTSHVNSLTANGQHALHLAASRGHLQAVQTISRDARVAAAAASVVTPRGETALHAAAHAGSLEVVKYFIEVLGADVGAKTVDGMTALQVLSALARCRIC